MIANLNCYITQLQTSPPGTKDANAEPDASFHPITPIPHRKQKIPDPPLFSRDRSEARTWIMDMRLKLAANTQLFQNNQAKMICINSRLEGTIKDQLHLFINNNLTFRFVHADAMFTFLSSLYDNPDCRRSAVNALGNLHQQNKFFSDYMPEFTQLMNNVGYTDDKSKIDLFLVKLSDKMNQLLIGQDMPTDYLGYITWLHKLDTDVRVINERICELPRDPNLRLEEIQLLFTLHFPPTPIPNHFLSKIYTQILIETGASGYAFISDSFSQSHNLPRLTPLSAPIVLETFDGRLVVSGNLTHKTTFVGKTQAPVRLLRQA